MTKKITDILSQLNINSISKLSIENEQKRVSVEFVDQHAHTHCIEFSSVDTYFYLDEKMLDEVYAALGKKEPITLFDGSYGEFVAVDEYDDGSIEEHTLAQPNVILNTENASLLMEAKQVTINGESYQLNHVLN